MKKLPIVLVFCLSISAVRAQDPTGAIQRAQAVEGTPYANPPNPLATFDCSSLTQYAYQPSFSLPIPAAAQAELGTPVNTIGELQPGDLVFWDTHLNRVVNHVGIYVGNNIAIAANYTNGVEEFDLTLNYWQTRFMFGRRLPGIAVALNPFGTSTATSGYVVQAVNPHAPTVPVAAPADITVTINRRAVTCTITFDQTSEVIIAQNQTNVSVPNPFPVARNAACPSTSVTTVWKVLNASISNTTLDLSSVAAELTLSVTR